MAGVAVAGQAGIEREAAGDGYGLGSRRGVVSYSVEPRGTSLGAFGDGAEELVEVQDRAIMEVGRGGPDAIERAGLVGEPGANDLAVEGGEVVLAPAVPVGAVVGGEVFGRVGASADGFGDDAEALGGGEGDAGAGFEGVGDEGGSEGEAGGLGGVGADMGEV